MSPSSSSSSETDDRDPRTFGGALYSTPGWSEEEDDILISYVVGGEHCVVPAIRPRDYIKPKFSWDTAAAQFSRPAITPMNSKYRYIKILSVRDPTDEEKLIFSVSYNGSCDRLWQAVKEKECLEDPWANLGPDMSVYFEGAGRSHWYRKHRSAMWLFLARVMMPKPIPWEVVEKLFWRLDEKQRANRYDLTS